VSRPVRRNGTLRRLAAVSTWPVKPHDLSTDSERNVAEGVCGRHAAGMPRRTDIDLRRLDDLLASQQHCVTLTQLAEVGLASSTIAYRTRPKEGVWQRPLPGVILTHRGTPTRDEQVAAALLYAGPEAVITGSEALRRCELDVPRSARVDLLVPHQQRRQSSGFVVVERTRTMPELTLVDGFPAQRCHEHWWITAVESVTYATSARS